MEKRIIAFDVGDKRVGVAVSDPFNAYAMPCETYVRTGEAEADAEALAKIAREKGVGTIVCGLPVNADGTESEQTEKTRLFVALLSEKAKTEIVFEDERYTTAMAKNDQLAAGISLKDKKRSIDSLAAAYILDGYLSKRKEKEKMTETFDEDYEEENIIELEDDEGNTEKFLHVGTIEYKGNWYCFFQKAEPETEEEEDEVVVYLLQGEEDDQKLVPIEDDSLMDEVFAEFCKEYEAYENSEDAKKLDGTE